MDALQQARRAADNADVINRPNDPHQELEFAMMYAAIAQAEAAQEQAAQLKRIADMIEGYLSVYHDGAVLAIARGEYGELGK